MAKTSIKTGIAGAVLGAAVLVGAPPSFADLSLEVVGSYASGQWDNAAAQVVAFDAASKLAFVANTKANEIDILDLSDPANPTRTASISLADYGAGVNSVAVSDGRVAAAIEAQDPQANGAVVVMDTAGKVLASLTVGAMPDMVTFSPDGQYILTANEGEPNDAYDNDPEGSVSIIDISQGLESLGASNVRTIVIGNGIELPPGAIGKPGAQPARDLEPEYVAVSQDSKTAFVSLQENNAIAVIDIPTGEVERVFGLGFKPYSKTPIDASDKDNKVNIKTHDRVFGIYQPDGIAAYQVDGNIYVVTANEGDSREYEAFEDETRVMKVTLDAGAFPNAATLQSEDRLGRLKINRTLGDTDGDGDFDELYNYGARSIAIWDTDGKLIADTGADFETKTATLLPNGFNADNDEGAKDKRSDDKGPEPETVVLGQVEGTTYAFVALERISAIIVHDISDPRMPRFAGLAHNRNFSVDPELVNDAAKTGDLAPEGLAFVSAEDSPIGAPLLIVGNEVSGTTTIYRISKQ